MNKGFAREAASRARSALGSTGARILLVTVALVIGTVLFLSIMNYRTTKNILQDRVGQLAEQMVTLLGYKIDVNLKNDLAMSDEMFSDAAFLQQLANYDSDDETVSFDGSVGVENAFKKYIAAQPNLRSISFVPVGGDKLPLSTDRQLKTEAIADAPWFREAIGQDGVAAWVTPRDGGLLGSSSDELIGYGRLLKAGISGAKRDYVMVVELALKPLVQDLEAVELTEQSRLYLIGADGAVLARTAMEGEGGEDGEGSLGGEETSASASADRFDAAKFGGEAGGYTDAGAADSAYVAYQRSPITGWYVAAKTPERDLTRDAQSFKRWAIVVSLIAFAAAVAVSAYLATRIGKPLARLRQLMQRASGGDLTGRVKAVGRDEIGVVGRHFNAMLDHLASLVAESNRIAGEVARIAAGTAGEAGTNARASDDILAALDEVAAGTESMATEAERGNHAVEDMHGPIRSSAAVHREMAVAVGQVGDISDEGMTLLRSLRASADRAEQIGLGAMAQADKLQGSTEAIHRILESLTGFAKQTRILALNATIEASRAGASGRGFSVIAAEIGKLADTSRESIELASDVVAAITSDADRSAQLNREMYAVVREQADAAADTERRFTQVKSLMQASEDKLRALGDAMALVSERQAVMSGTVGSFAASAEELFAISADVADKSRQQYGTSQSLLGMAKQLEEIAGRLQRAMERFILEEV